MPDDSKPGGQSPLDSTTTDTVPPSAPVKARRIRPLYILAAAITVAVFYVAWTEIHNRLNFIHEEDARIHADLVTVSSRVAGWITEMPIAEGDQLSQGAVMVQVDDRESNIQLNELQAQLAASGAQRSRLAAERILVNSQIESRMQSEVSQVAAADVAVSSLRPQLQLAKRELNRTQRLFEDKVASRRQLDQAENQLQQIDREYRIAVAGLEAAKSGLAEAEADRARLGVLAGDLSVLESREQEIKARIERQRLDIQDRTVKSPTAGVVDRIFVDIGEYVTPGQRLALVHNQDLVWVEANIKETDVRKLKQGQIVNIHVDAYPDDIFNGTVKTIGSAATNQFALLPTPNPSGNFTKITQRLPVRIAFDKPDPRLRPGMMVEIEIAIEE
tara:strand:+ start:28284 stop:29447 length:1164 start_codon:yes stop_codon:yes gene_type:complete